MYIYISVISVIFVLNFLGFFLAYFFKTDKFTDISYSLSFVCGLITLFYFIESFTLPYLILFSLVAVWAIRLGSYLLKRIHKMGRDKRFDEMRGSILKFGTFWTLQMITVFILMLPVIYLVNIATIDFSFVQLVGTVIFLFGFIVEWVADYQKNKFKAENPDQLFTGGLYSIVRYPNYLGEILVWIGIWVFGLNFYSPTAMLTVISPLWIFLLLRFVSGIPLVESKRAEKYHDDEKYRHYIEHTPMLFPKLNIMTSTKDDLYLSS